MHRTTLEVPLPGLRKGWRFPELGAPDGGLQVGDFQVESEMGEDILVVVPERQLPELCIMAISEAVVSARRTPAVPTPVPERFDKALEGRVVRKEGPVLSHRDVVRDEDPRQPVLEERRDRGQETHRNCDHFVPFPESVAPSFGEVRAAMAKRLAEDPELVRIQCLTPR